MSEEQFDTLSSVSESKYINHPKVGEEIEITLKGFKLNPDTKVKTASGKTFDKALSSVDFTYDLYDVSGKVYSIRTWQVWGKIKNIFQKLETETGAGVKVKIAHVSDGMQNRDKDPYEVYAFVDNSWKKLNSDNNWE